MTKSEADKIKDVPQALKKTANSTNATVLAKTNDKSIPACTSLGCKTESIVKPPKPDYPVDYPVANHGMDHDIEASI
jgi:hypothetical protein